MLCIKVLLNEIDRWREFLEAVIKVMININIDCLKLDYTKMK